MALRKTWKLTETHNDKSKGKSAYCTLMFDHTWNGGNDEHNVPNERNSDCDTDRFKPSPVGIGDVSTNQRRHITPTYRREARSRSTMMDLTRTGKMLSNPWKHVDPCQVPQIGHLALQRRYESQAGEVAE